LEGQRCHLGRTLTMAIDELTLGLDDDLQRQQEQEYARQNRREQIAAQQKNRGPNKAASLVSKETTALAAKAISATGWGRILIIALKVLGRMTGREVNIESVGPLLAIGSLIPVFTFLFVLIVVGGGLFIVIMNIVAPIDFISGTLCKYFSVIINLFGGKC